MKTKYSLFPLLTLCMMAGCKKKEESGVPDSSDLLFEKSEALIRSYIDSVNAGNDSTDYHGIISRLDGKLTNLNYDFPADTDLGMSEEQNDSLITLFKLLEATVEKKRNPDPVLNDSIASDVELNQDSLISSSASR